MNWRNRVCALAMLFCVCGFGVQAQGKRKVIIDQDAAGPGGTDMQSILALVNSPDTDVLGITVLDRRSRGATKKCSTRSA